MPGNGGQDRADRVDAGVDDQQRLAAEPVRGRPGQDRSGGRAQRGPGDQVAQGQALAGGRGRSSARSRCWTCRSRTESRPRGQQGQLPVEPGRHPFIERLENVALGRWLGHGRSLAAVRLARLLFPHRSKMNMTRTKSPRPRRIPRTPPHPPDPAASPGPRRRPAQAPRAHRSCSHPSQSELQSHRHRSYQVIRRGCPSHAAPATWLGHPRRIRGTGRGCQLEITGHRNALGTQEHQESRPGSRPTIIVNQVALHPNSMNAASTPYERRDGTSRRRRRRLRSWLP